MEKIKLLAPAKLNLSLDIVGKTNDGYHLLETVMQAVTLFDEIIIQKAESGINVFCDSCDIPDGKKNIAYKAANLFFDYTDKPFGINISINKKIPSQAGMGGGSSDAAAVLYGLNKMAGSGFSDDILLALAKKAGADVPFCINGGTMLAEGIGEVLTPIKSVESCFFVIVKPKLCVSTRAAFEAADKGAIKRHPDTQKLVAFLNEGDINAASKYFYNVFEEVTSENELYRIKKIMLEQGGFYAAMTGSGSAVFAICSDKNKALFLKSFLEFKGYNAVIAEPYNKGITNLE